MQRDQRVWDIARGKWRPLLLALAPGLSERVLNGRNQPCPMCGGKDRFRFTDFKGDGCYLCNQCGTGTGIQLLQRLTGMSFADAAAAVEDRAGHVKVEIRKATTVQRFDTAKLVEDTWKAARPLEVGDPVTTYLRRRGVKLERWPSMLRYHPHMRHAADTEGGGRRVSYHPAMVAYFVSPDTKLRTCHTTYLTGGGDKAKLEKNKLFSPGSVPPGGAVRLAPSAETMGIAEGIETALSAAAIHGIPVWAALDGARLMTWEPPETAKSILIFGDNDRHFKGQAVAYQLANRLRSNKRFAWIEVVEVRIPDIEGADWNDMLQGDAA